MVDGEVPMLALLVAVALAGDPDLVPVSSGYRGVDVTLSVGVDVPVQAFVDAVLDADHYPMSASYLGVPAMVESRTLAHRGSYAVIYQRTGSSSLFRARHYVTAMKVTQLSADRGVVEWWLVRHAQVDGVWTGEFAQALQAHPDAVYTPYSHGSWDYNRAAHTLRYRVESDPGGSVPSWLVSDAAATVFPKELLAVRFGVR